MKRRVIIKKKVNNLILSRHKLQATSLSFTNTDEFWMDLTKNYLKASTKNDLSDLISSLHVYLMSKNLIPYCCPALFYDELSDVNHLGSVGVIGGKYDSVNINVKEPRSLFEYFHIYLHEIRHHVQKLVFNGTLPQEALINCKDGYYNDKTNYLRNLTNFSNNKVYSKEEINYLLNVIKEENLTLDAFTYDCDYLNDRLSNLLSKYYDINSPKFIRHILYLFEPQEIDARVFSLNALRELYYDSLLKTTDLIRNDLLSYIKYAEELEDIKKLLAPFYLVLEQKLQNYRSSDSNLTE